MQKQLIIGTMIVTKVARMLILDIEMLVLVTLYKLEVVPDGAEVGPPERVRPLPVLGGAYHGHQDGSHHDHHPVAGDVLVEDIPYSEDLYDKSHEVTLPELVVLEGVGGDVVWAAKVQQEEWCPERNQVVLSCGAAQGKITDGVYCGRVGQLVRQPEDEPLHRRSFAPAYPGEDVEDNLQREAQEHQDLGRPLVPQIHRPSCHCCDQ
ncbi:Os04g0155750, partial [Oryza sativa Japonica Group]